MNTQHFNRGLTQLKKGIINNLPKILTVLGIGFGIAATVTATKNTPEFKEDWAEAKEANEGHIEPKEAVKIIAKHYIEPVAYTGLAIASHVTAQHINDKTIAGWAALYTTTERYLSVYRDNVIEELGKTKAERVESKTVKVIAEEQMQKPENVDYPMTDEERTASWYMDGYTKTVFRSTPEKIRGAFNRINEKLINNGYVSFQEYQVAIGIPYQKTSGIFGEMLGWSEYQGLLEPYTKLARIGDSDGVGEPCMSLEASIQPKDKYWKSN